MFFKMEKKSFSLKSINCGKTYNVTYAVTMLFERTKNAACICIYLKYYVVSMLMFLNPIIVYMKTK